MLILVAALLLGQAPQNKADQDLNITVTNDSFQQPTQWKQIPSKNRLTCDTSGYITCSDSDAQKDKHTETDSFQDREDKASLSFKTLRSNLINDIQTKVISDSDLTEFILLGPHISDGLTPYNPDNEEIQKQNFLYMLEVQYKIRQLNSGTSILSANDSNLVIDSKPMYKVNVSCKPGYQLYSWEYDGTLDLSRGVENIPPITPVDHKYTARDMITIYSDDDRLNGEHPFKCIKLNSLKEDTYPLLFKMNISDPVQSVSCFQDNKQINCHTQ